MKCLQPQSVVAPSGECLRGKDRHGVIKFAGKTVIHARAPFWLVMITALYYIHTIYK